MRTSIGLFAAASFLIAPLAASAQEVSFKSYPEAQEFGQKVGKPLAVFVSAGRAGYEQITQEGSFNNEVRKILSDAYVCVYLDADRAENQPLIRQFGIKTGNGLVLSDRTGQVQAYHHDGLLPGDDLARQLNRYADPGLVVRTTASNGSARLSYYPAAGLGQESDPGSYGAPAPYPAPAYQPAFAAPAMSGRSC